MATEYKKILWVILSGVISFYAGTIYFVMLYGRIPGIWNLFTKNEEKDTSVLKFKS